MPIHRLLHLIRIGLSAGCLLTAAAAQDLDELSTLLPESLAAMEAEKWEEALKLLTQSTKMKPDEALRAFGPQYGAVWYRRGICEMKLQRWEAAIHSFETCYQDYPNRGSSGGNLYQTKALLKWGESAVGAKRWDLAISRFRKFLAERDRTRDKFQQGAFHVTLGICHYRLGHLPEGNEQLEIAIRNRGTFPTSADQIVAGIQALVAAAIIGKNEAAVLDFLSNNQASLSLEPHRALAFAAVYLKLASDADTSGMPRAALALYQQVLDPAAAAAELKARLKSPGADKSALEAALSRLDEDSRSSHPIRLLKLAGMASAQEAMGNRQMACGLREQVARDFPESPVNEENLLRLTRLRLELAVESEHEGRTDQAISGYEKTWMEGKGGSAARAAKRWMELVWARNREGDRLSACRGGLSFLEATEEDESELSEDDRTSRDEVASLTRTFRAALEEKSRSTP
jgi:tetratricopeptide (TPR) repeat protein